MNPDQPFLMKTAKDELFSTQFNIVRNWCYSSSYVISNTYLHANPTHSMWSCDDKGSKEHHWIDHLGMTMPNVAVPGVHCQVSGQMKSSSKLFLFNWNRISHPGDYRLLYRFCLQLSILGKAVLGMHGPVVQWSLALGAAVDDFRGPECQIGLSRPEDSSLLLPAPALPISHPVSLLPSATQKPQHELGRMHLAALAVTPLRYHCRGKNEQGSCSGTKGVGWPCWMLTKYRHFPSTGECKSFHYTG